MLWVQNGVLSRNSLNILQEKVDNCMVMGNIGRIPQITSQFSSLIADEWKNWRLLF